MNTPGLNHVVITVSDIPRAIQFYGELLGFEIHHFAEYNTFFFPVGPATIWVVQHEQTPAGDRFSEFRVGLDHLSFTAPDEASLRELADKLLAAGVDTKGVEKFVSGNLYMAFRDPDNIQLEYWLPNENG